MTRLVTEYSKSDFWVMELAEILWVFKVFVVQKLKKRPFQMNLCLHSIYFKNPCFGYVLDPLLGMCTSKYLQMQLTKHTRP